MTLYSPLLHIIIFLSVKRNLLIVEDNVRMRNLIKDLFSNSFENIYECSDGSEALLAYTNVRPDWVFMDLKMEVQDGITATREIMKYFPDAKILIVTDFDDEELKFLTVQSGAIDYILKENLEDIFNIINK